MTLTQLSENLKSIKVKKVRGENLWRVVDTRMSERWYCLGEFTSKDEAEDFATRCMTQR